MTPSGLCQVKWSVFEELGKNGARYMSLVFISRETCVVGRDYLKYNAHAMGKPYGFFCRVIAPFFPPTAVIKHKMWTNINQTYLGYLSQTVPCWGENSCCLGLVSSWPLVNATYSIFLRTKPDWWMISRLLARCRPAVVASSLFYTVMRGGFLEGWSNWKKRAWSRLINREFIARDTSL